MVWDGPNALEKKSLTEQLGLLWLATQMDETNVIAPAILMCITVAQSEYLCVVQKYWAQCVTKTNVTQSIMV